MRPRTQTSGHRRSLRLIIAVTAVLCVVILAACGSGGSSSKHSGSPAAVAAGQLASADHESTETATLTADLTTLDPDCQETTATLATEISDGEQDLIRHGIKADAMRVANALVTAADVLPKAQKPAVCNQLIAVYLNSQGG